MHLARSGIAVAAGFAVFTIVFAVLGPGLGAVLTTLAAGLLAGYVTARIAKDRETRHGAAAAALVAVSLVSQPVLTLPERVLVAALAVAAISAGAWVRGQGRIARAEPTPQPGPVGHDASDETLENRTLPRHSSNGEGGEGRT